MNLSDFRIFILNFVFAYLLTSVLVPSIGFGQTVLTEAEEISLEDYAQESIQSLETKWRSGARIEWLDNDDIPNQEMGKISVGRQYAESLVSGLSNEHKKIVMDWVIAHEYNHYLIDTNTGSYRTDEIQPKSAECISDVFGAYFAMRNHLNERDPIEYKNYQNFAQSTVKIFAGKLATKNAANTQNNAYPSNDERNAAIYFGFLRALSDTITNSTIDSRALAIQNLLHRLLIDGHRIDILTWSQLICDRSMQENSLKELVNFRILRNFTHPDSGDIDYEVVVTNKSTNPINVMAQVQSVLGAESNSFDPTKIETVSVRNHQFWIEGGKNATMSGRLLGFDVPPGEKPRLFVPGSKQDSGIENFIVSQNALYSVDLSNLVTAVPVPTTAKATLRSILRDYAKSAPSNFSEVRDTAKCRFQGVNEICEPKEQYNLYLGPELLNQVISSSSSINIVIYRGNDESEAKNLKNSWESILVDLYPNVQPKSDLVKNGPFDQNGKPYFENRQSIFIFDDKNSDMHGVTLLLGYQSYDRDLKPPNLPNLDEGFYEYQVLLSMYRSFVPFKQAR